MPPPPRNDDDLTRAAGRAIVEDDWRPPDPFSGHAHPVVDRFGHTPEHSRAWFQGLGVEDIKKMKEATSFVAGLPDPTKEWLKSLTKEDLKELPEVIRFQRSARIIGRFGKWLIWTIVGTFGSAILFGEQISKALKYLGSVKP